MIRVLALYHNGELQTTTSLTTVSLDAYLEKKLSLILHFMLIAGAIVKLYFAVSIVLQQQGK